MDHPEQAAPDWLLFLHRESWQLAALWGCLSGLLAGIGVYLAASVGFVPGLIAVLAALGCAYGTAESVREHQDAAQALGRRCRTCGRHTHKEQ